MLVWVGAQEEEEDEGAGQQVGWQQAAGGGVGCGCHWHPDQSITPAWQQEQRPSASKAAQCSGTLRLPSGLLCLENEEFANCHAHLDDDKGRHAHQR